jgi:hypothetical protein
MEDPTNDPREFAHPGNVGFDEEGLPPGIDTFLCICSLGSGIGYSLNFPFSHVAESYGSWNDGQNASDNTLQL